MTNPQSNNDTNLNHIDLSLNEFLGAPWKDKKNSQTNIEAIKMLLMPTDEAEQSHELANSKFIRRKDRQTDITLKTAMRCSMAREMPNLGESPVQARTLRMRRPRYDVVFQG